MKMKKIVAMFLIVVLALPALALADLPDISKLTEQELIDLSKEIGTKLFGDKLAEGITVPPGDYIIGDDIPSGSYKIVITGGMGFFVVYTEKGGRTKISGVTGEAYNVIDIGKLTLEDGNVLHLVNSTFVFYPYVNLFN